METHNVIKDYFLIISSLFEKKFNEAEKKIFPFQKQNHDWLNYFYNSPLFRHIHLEYYKTEKICVLHVNAFPDPKIDLPILGFDLIALNNKITGLFFDFTPTFTTYSKLEYELDKLSTKYKSFKRQLPEWANFFSNRFYCIEPLPEELDNIFQDIVQSINVYFELYSDEFLRYSLRIKKQNTYCEGQKKNDKTFKALAAEIGKSNSLDFLNNYLFPKILEN